MARKKLSPAELIAARFGGSREASRVLGYTNELTIACWKARGGFIPKTEDVRHILSVANLKGVDFSLEEAVYGGYANGAEK